MTTRYLRMTYNDRLTVTEARALCICAMYAIGHPTAMEEIFKDDHHDKTAAGRGYGKLSRAWATAQMRPADHRTTRNLSSGLARID